MSTNLKCCICNEPAPAGNIYAGRAYCDRHLAAVHRPNPSFWRSAFVQVILMGAFAAIVAVVTLPLTNLDQTALIVIGLFLAIVPTGLWLWYFYRQDRLEPEPKTKIAGVFLLALLLTDAVGLRIVGPLFNVSQWAVINRTTSLLANILIFGFTFETIKYVAIRAIVYATDEFDERMDGVVYGTTAGLGVATLLNLHHIIDNQGVALAPGVISVVTTALAQACFGGLLGYFMAEAKFSHRPIWWVPGGLALSSVLSGLFTWLIDEVSASGLSVNPWNSLLLGVAVALATFLVLVWLMRRSIRMQLGEAKS
ncbi:MAG: PrsW family intramembrane metalloprotease [Chloroflexi bacterium]|nr:PrsW family intramembrane metalloprotease [Chloroflexota bacterium]